MDAWMAAAVWSVAQPPGEKARERPWSPALPLAGSVRNYCQGRATRPHVCGMDNCSGAVLPGDLILPAQAVATGHAERWLRWLRE